MLVRAAVFDEPEEDLELPPLGLLAALIRDPPAVPGTLLLVPREQDAAVTVPIRAEVLPGRCRRADHLLFHVQQGIR